MMSTHFPYFFPLLGAMNCLSAIAHRRERLLHLAFPFFLRAKREACLSEGIVAVAPMHVDIYVDHIMVPRTSVQSSIDL